MPITLYGDGFITGLGNVTTSGGVTASNISLGNVTMSQNNLIASLGTNGWQRLPSGLLMQWGTTSGANGTITFSIPFTTAVYNLTSGSTGATWIVFQSITLSTVSFAQRTNVSGYAENSGSFYWHAIGV